MMADDRPARFARRLLALATAAMPPSRRDWGRAMAAELASARSGGERARLVLGAVRVALLPLSGDAGYGRIAARVAALAVIAYVPIGLVDYVSDVVFPSSADSDAWVLPGNAYLIVALMAAGALARYARPGLAAPVLAGLAAGLVFALLGDATFAVIGNSQVKTAALGMAIVTIVMGAVFAPLGAIGVQEADLARHRWRLSRRH